MALAVHLENLAVVRDAVQERRRHPLALEDLVPLAERQVARDQHAGTLVPFGENPEEQLHAAATERNVPQFVTDQQMHALQLAHELVERVLLLCLLELRHQLRGGEKANAQTMAARGLADGNGDVRLPSSVRSDQTTVVVLFNPITS